MEPKTLAAGLFSLLLVAAPHPVRDSAMARHLWLAARDQEALLHYDSALALYRAARRTDPSYLTAQLGYIDLMRHRFQYAELQREYRLGPGETDAVARCLALATTWLAAPGDPAAWALRLERLEPASSCAYVLSGDFEFPDALSLRYGRRAELGMPERAQIWAAYATALNTAGRWREARANLEEGSRRVPHVLDRIFLLSILVDWHMQRGDTAGAEAMRRAIRQATARDGRPGVALLSVGVGLRPDSRSSHHERLRIAQAAGCWLEEWKALREIAKLMIDRGEPAKALRFADREIAIADSVGLPGLVLLSYTQRGRAYAKAGLMDAASRDLVHAVRLGRRVRPVLYLADAWHNLAHAYEGQGRFGQASVAADRYLALAESTLGSERLTSLLDAGLIRWKAGRRADSRIAYEAMIRWVDTHHVERYWAGEYLERMGDLHRALVYYRAGAAEPHQAVVNLKGQERVFEALGYLDSAEAAARRHDASDWHVPNEVPLMPRVLARQGRLDEALRITRAWVARQGTGGNVQGEALARLELAELLLVADQPWPSSIEAARAETLAMRLNLTEELIAARRQKGTALLLAGDRAAGLSALESAAELARSHPTAPGIVATRTALGDALAVSNPAAALASYEVAAASIENLTGRLDEDLDRVGYRERHLAPFDGAMRTLLHNRPTAARLEALLQWSERRKGAALALATQMTRAYPALRRLGVRAMQSRLGHSEALVDYTVLDGAVAALVITSRQAAVVQLPATRDSLAGMVDRLRRPLSATYGRRLDLARAPFDLALAHSLYLAVMAPLAPAIVGIDHLLIVPDGPLHYLPFEALAVDASRAISTVTDYASPHYAIDDFEIEYLPSAELLASSEERLQSLARSGRLLAVVRGVESGARELEAIRAAWGASRVSALEERAAAETAVRGDMPRFSVLHFAVHATAEARDPLASHIALAPDSLADGLLRMNEIAAQRTTARLVVLSACETQAGRNYSGEGVMSLGRGFLLAGARAVVATRWPVGPSAADIMGGFYRDLARGAPPSAALRSARLTLRHDPRSAHPFYWASFVLFRS